MDWGFLNFMGLMVSIGLAVCLPRVVDLEEWLDSTEHLLAGEKKPALILGER